MAKFKELGWILLLVVVANCGDLFVNGSNPEIGNSTAYQECSKSIEKNMDPTVDVCDDFYGYVCNNYKGDYQIINDVDLENRVKFVQFLKGLDTKDEIKPVQQELAYFKSCVDFRTKHNLSDPIVEDQQKSLVAKPIVGQLEKEIGIEFPLAKNETNASIDSKSLSHAIGFLHGNFLGVYPLMFSIVEADKFNHKHGNRLTFDAPLLTLPPSAYLQDWEQNKAYLTSKMTQQLYTYFNVTNIKVCNKTIVEEVDKLTKLEWTLAQGYKEEKSYDYESFTIKNATEHFHKSIDFSTLLLTMAKNDPEVSKIFNGPDYFFYIEPAKNFQQFASQLQKVLTDFEASTIWNYVFYRVISGATVSNYRRETKKAIHDSEFKVPKNHPLYEETGITPDELVCMSLLELNFKEINDNLFVRAMYPNVTQRKASKEDAFAMLNEDLIAFKSMIKEIPWLDSESKQFIENKVNHLESNIIYLNKTFDNKYLEAYYNDLNFNGKTEFTDLQVLVNPFMRKKFMLKLRSTKEVDRNFLIDAAYMGAYNIPELNVIEILAAITQAPIYHVDYPAAVKFGGLAFTVGHEVSHGYDQVGIGYNQEGELTETLREKLAKNPEYNKMVDCVVQDYNTLCLNQTCINGTRTANENMADLAGIEASFRAYQNHVKKHGEDLRLPGKITSKLTNDQLFFVAVAKNWCINPKQPLILTDPHTPNKFRMWGLLRNFKGFRKTFNCKIGSKYAPKEEICSVWTANKS